MKPIPANLFALFAVFLLGPGTAIAATTIDIRQCPIDTVTFVDQWAGDEFTVSRVGTAHYYICEGKVAKNPKDIANCERGPFGDTVLQGRIKKSPSGSDDGGVPKDIYVIWRVEPAVPCCGWSASDKTEAKVLGEYSNFEWTKSDKMPTIGELGLGAIEKSNASNRDFVRIIANPMLPMKCVLKK